MTAKQFTRNKLEADRRVEVLKDEKGHRKGFTLMESEKNRRADISG